MRNQPVANICATIRFRKFIFQIERKSVGMVGLEGSNKIAANVNNASNYNPAPVGGKSGEGERFIKTINLSLSKENDKLRY